MNAAETEKYPKLRPAIAVTEAAAIMIPAEAAVAMAETPGESIVTLATDMAGATPCATPATAKDDFIMFILATSATDVAGSKKIKNLKVCLVAYLFLSIDFTKSNFGGIITL